MKRLAPLDLAKNELQNAVVQVLGTDPSSPATGQIYYNSTDHRLKQYNGTTWDEYSTATSAGDASTNTSTSVDSEVAVFSGTTGKLLKRATGSGIAKLTSGVLSTATSGTDYAPATSGSSVLKGNGSGGTTAATSGTDYSAGTSALATGILKSTTTTGALTIAVAGDFPTLNQNTTGTAANLSGTPALPNGTTATTQTASDNSTKLATTSYVDTAVTTAANGFDVKGSVRAATTATVTLAGSAPNTLDGVTLAANDRILVKNQSTASQNGIYYVSTLGTGANGTWTRATDADSSAEVTAGMYTWVTEGTTQADSGWYLTTDDPITLGTTSLTFTQFNGLGQVTAGTGLSKSANTLSIDTTVTVDKTTAQVLTNKDLSSGTNTFPTFNQNTTGSAAKLTTARTINGVSFDGTANVTVPGNSATATYGDGSTTAFAITHGLLSSWPLVQLFEVSTGNMVEADIQRTSSTVVTITHTVAPTTNQYRYVMFG